MPRLVGNVLALVIAVCVVLCSANTLAREIEQRVGESGSSVDDQLHDSTEAAKKQTVDKFDGKTPIHGVDSDKSARVGAADSILSVFGALCVVLCAFLGMVVIWRWLSNRGKRFSNRVCQIEVTDRMRYDGKTELVTIRWRNVEVLAAYSSGRWSPLAELNVATNDKRSVAVSGACVELEDDKTSSR